MMIYKEHKNAILSILGLLVWTLLFVPTLTTNHALAASVPFALQDTKVSGPDPIPGHEVHEAVSILPQRNDTKIYTGTVTYSSSIPVELIVTHPFNLTRVSTNTTTTSFVPEPLTVPGQNTSLSILHEIGQGAQFDTIPFSGSSLSLHNRAGQNFTVSYSVAGNLIDVTGLPK